MADEESPARTDEAAEAPAGDDQGKRNGQIQASARKAALAALEDLRAKADPPGELHLSCGIVLKITAPPQHLIALAAAKVPKPKVPEVFIEEKGRKEENPNDPDYLAALADYEDAQYIASGDVALLMGTACMSVPEGVFRPEEDGWIDYLKALDVLDGLDLESPPARYLAWLKYYALRSPTDISTAIYGPLHLANLSEEDVAIAIAAFRRSAGRRAHNGSLFEEQSADRDPLPRPVSRAGKRARRKRERAVRPDPVVALAGTVEGGAGAGGGAQPPA